MARSKGRTGRPWRRIADEVRATTDVCSICGHGGATTVHHDPPLQVLEAQGLDPRDPQFLKVAHGAGGRHKPNPCPTCGLHCNQVAGSKVGFTLPAFTASRRW